MYYRFFFNLLLLLLRHSHSRPLLTHSAFFSQLLCVWSRPLTHHRNQQRSSGLQWSVIKFGQVHFEVVSAPCRGTAASILESKHAKCDESVCKCSLQQVCKSRAKGCFYTIQRMQIVQLKKCVIPKQIKNRLTVSGWGRIQRTTLLNEWLGVYLWGLLSVKHPNDELDFSLVLLTIFQNLKVLFVRKVHFWVSFPAHLILTLWDCRLRWLLSQSLESSVWESKIHFSYK